MTLANGEVPHTDAMPRPSAAADAAAGGAVPKDAWTPAAAPLRGCPFLVADAGGWRLDVPSRAHRCGAVSPPAPLAPEKQARLCLTEAHASCATLLASLAARDARLGSRAASRTTRWGLARTTTVIEDAGGLRSRVMGLLLDRGRWPAVPAVILVATLVVLAASGLRPGSPASATATATPARPGPTAVASASPTAAATGTAEPAETPSSPPTAAPSSAPQASPGPSVAFVTYKVKSGDTLSGIASKFHTTSRAIADLNGISTGATLHIGQVLKIPSS